MSFLKCSPSLVLEYKLNDGVISKPKYLHSLVVSIFFFPNVQKTYILFFYINFGENIRVGEHSH